MLKLTCETRFGTWLSEWQEVYKKPYIRPCSLVNIDICVRLHIPDSLKDTPLKDLQAFDLQRGLNSVPTSRTRLSTYNVLNDSLRCAFMLGLIPRNPVELIKPPKHKRVLGQALNHDELAEFLCACNNSICRNYFLFCVYTGCRRSEAINAEWSDVDFKKGLLHIRGTKTDCSDRYIPLFPDLAALLGSMRPKDCSLFHFTSDYVTREFKRICPSHKLHDLRHTFATVCIECGISLKVVQKWLGHTRLSTTANIYVHALDSFVLSESSKFKMPV